MSKAQVDLQELLAYGDTHASWFALKEQMPHTLVKRNLKLLRGLRDSTTTPEELERLTEDEIKKAVSEYRTRMPHSPLVVQRPTTTAQYFHSILEKSPYFSEIIAYSGRSPLNPIKPQSTPLPASIKTNADDTSIKRSASVHGFYLNEQEAFSSTRYFSDDKKSYAQVIARDCAFEAHHQNLNSNQKTDLAFEISFQFLLNRPAESKTITIAGSPEMVHRVHAACLYLQKEAGPRYADLKFKLPHGLSIAPGELNDAYINKHLGALNETPQQVVQWRDFLKMATNSPAEPTPTPNPTEQKPPLIDMERVFHAPDLSQQDKVLLNEYQRYLKDTWIDGLKDCKGKTELLIAEHEEFMQRTEKVLPLFKKAPSLEREFEALKMLYINTTELHQRTLESLHQNSLEYEAQLKALMPEAQKAEREALESCADSINEHLQMEIGFNPDLTEELCTTLLSHEQNMQAIKLLIKDKKELPADMMRSCGAQMVQALNFLEGLKDYSKSPIFKKMKDFSKAQAETEEKVIKTAPEQLMQASNHVKERLNQFKKEFQEPKVSEVLLDAKIKEQLDALIKKAERFTKGIEVEESQLPIEQLTELLQQLSGSSKVSTMQINALHKGIDDVLPCARDNPRFVQVLFQMKTLTTAPLVVEELPQKPSNERIQPM